MVETGKCEAGQGHNDLQGLLKGSRRPARVSRYERLASDIGSATASRDHDDHFALSGYAAGRAAKKLWAPSHGIHGDVAIKATAVVQEWHEWNTKTEVRIKSRFKFELSGGVLRRMSV